MPRLITYVCECCFREADEETAAREGWRCDPVEGKAIVCNECAGRFERKEKREAA